MGHALEHFWRLFGRRPGPPRRRRILMAAVLDQRTVALNIGEGAGAEVGARFELQDSGTSIVYDGEYLGAYQRPAVTVEVTEVQERLAVARLHRPAPLWSSTAADRLAKTPMLPDWVAVGSTARPVGL
jgi:hypothetical protein